MDRKRIAKRRTHNIDRSHLQKTNEARIATLDAGRSGTLLAQLSAVLCVALPQFYRLVIRLLGKPAFVSADDGKSFGISKA